MPTIRTLDRMTSRAPRLLISVALAACTGQPVTSSLGTDPTPSCSGRCAESAPALTIPDVERVLAQGINEALARGVNATLAVVDRVGNVLAVYRMGEPLSRKVILATQLDGAGAAVLSSGLEGIRLPVDQARVNLDQEAAIAKAITGAFLSSEGNAFSTRTASQIVQENFNPQEDKAPAGPLFGVQFSQLACSDLMRAWDGNAPSVGPHRSPLGLSADPGGFPLYKNGTPVGGVGVMADGVYGLDRIIADRDADLDEAIATAATFGYGAPIDRRADRITADGKTLRFSDVEYADLARPPAQAPRLGDFPPGTGTLIRVIGYSDGTIKDGTSFGQPASGIRPDREGLFAGQDAFVLVDAADALRYPPRAGSDGAQVGAAVLRDNEVQAVLRAALAIANRARAQIRRPVGSQARVTISVVDSLGQILGVARTRDAPVFGIDVSLQKARSAAFFSSDSAAAYLQALPDAKYLLTSDAEMVRVARAVRLGGYVDGTRVFLGDGAAFSNGAIAYSARTLGNIARPFFPDGINGELPGGLSKPAGEWSVLSTGLQLDLSINSILQHVLYVAGALGIDVKPGCAGLDLTVNPTTVNQVVTDLRLGNGLQIFPGGVPLYRGGTLVGAIGVSGDGVDQDDMIAFLGLHDAGVALGGAISNAPPARRADTLSPRGVRLRYVQCPQAPFLGSDEQRPCGGK